MKRINQNSTDEHLIRRCSRPYLITRDTCQINLTVNGQKSNMQIIVKGKTS